MSENFISHNRLVAGSNPAGPTSALVPLESLQLRELLLILLGNRGRRFLELRGKTNQELLALYHSELVFRHRSSRGLAEAKRVINLFFQYLGEFPPSPELAKSFLAQFADRKPATLARYVAILKVFFKWYGEDLNLTIRVPKSLPAYVYTADVEKLVAATTTKRTHKKTIERDTLLVDLLKQTGLRRGEAANLQVGDIDLAMFSCALLDDID